MKHLKLIFACLLTAIFSIGQVWAADAASVELCTSWSQTFAYATAYTHDYSIDDLNGGTTTMTLGVQGVYRQANAHTYFQMNKKTGYFKNTTALPGKITKIETTWSAAKGATKCYFANGAEATSSDATVTVSAGTSVTYTPDNEADYYFFNIDVSTGSGSAQMTSCVVYYEKAGGTPDPSVSLSPSSLDLDAEDVENQSVTITASNFASAISSVTTGLYSDAECATPITSGAWVKDITVNAAKTTVTFNVDDNETGAARECWLKVSATDGTGNASAAVHIAQKKIVVDYATLPFSFTGGRADIETADGMTQSGLGTDYSATEKLKFDGTGDWLKIKINADPGKLSYQIKGNGFSGGTFTIQQSADDETYSDLATYSEDGSVELALAKTTRYVKFIYTSKSSGNIGLGNIAISLPVDVEAPTISGVTPFLSSTEVTLTQNDADAIYYTTDEAKKENPSVDTWTEYNSASKPSFNATTTIYAAAIKGSAWSAVAEQTFTKATVLTVAEAIAAIPNKNDVVDNQYVSGIVCTAGASVSSGKMTYYISDDGSETNRLQIYHGKNLNNTDFTAVSDLAIGDRVTVFGQLKNFNNTPEMNDGNYLVSKEGPAVAAPVFSPDGGGFMGEASVSITSATDGATIYYTTNGSTPDNTSTPYTSALVLSETTTIKAIAYKDEAHSVVVSKTFTKSEPMTVAEAYDALVGDNIANVAVEGIVYKVDKINNNGTATYWISDDGTEGEKVLEVFNGRGVNNANFEADGILVQDKVIVFGTLTIYDESTKEFTSGSRLLSLIRKADPQISWDPVSAELTLNDYLTPADYPEPELIILADLGDNPLDFISLSSDNESLATINKTNDGQIKISWKPDVSGTVHFTATYPGNDTYKAVTAVCTVTINPDPASLSPWATTYTSNVAMAHTGSGVDNGTITIGTDDPYLLVKAGAKDNTGTIVVTVPYGTTDLHFHAFAWGGKTAKIQISGVTNPSVSEFDLAGEAGAAGSGNDFTLQGDPVDQYFHVSFDAVAAETEITFSKATGSADNRFFFYGVNQEGGLILESISVSGTATALEYNEGDHFSPAGLGVTGHYSDASTAPITEGIVWAFDPDPLTEGTESVSVTATAGGKTSAAFVVNGLTVGSAAPLSPWATVYTSNVEMSDATVSKVVINETEYDAMKAGTGSAAGSVNVAIPAQTTTLHFHASGWDGKDVTLNLTAPSGITITPASVNLTADAGVSGNGTTYTLANDPSTTAYFAVTLSGNTDAFTLNIANEGSKKQFVLFGVNQVGGVLPVLKSIEISGDLTTKSGYKVGDALDMDGLTVSAIYTLNDVDQAPVDVTSLVNWSYDPLVEGQTSVTITATLEDKSDDITISDLEAVASADPMIYVDPSLTVNFGSVVVDEAVPANKTISVTLTNVAAATATLGGTNPEAFNIDKTALVDGDVITISVIASTAAAASYSATITITDDAAAATEKVVNLSFAVTEPAVEESPVSTTSKWVAATEIVNNMQVLITGFKSSKRYAMGAQTDNNRTAVEGTMDGDVFTPGENTMAFTIVDQGDGTFALRTSNGKYLYAASSSKNYLRSQDEVDDNAKWTLTVTSAVANGTNTIKDLKLNSSSNIFSCYSSAQTAIALYVPKQDTPEPPVEDWVEVRTGLEVNRHYTVCLEKNITNIDGATFWSLDKRNEAGTLAYLEEEIAPEAGKPYIIQATKATLKVVYGDEAVATPVANGALRGTFDKLEAADLNAINVTPNVVYMLFNNELRPIGSDNHLDAHRAYVLYNELQAVSADPVPAPGRRIKAMPMQGTEAQGVDNLNASETPVKMMIDGQLFIIRGEKMYDATGRLVK